MNAVIILFLIFLASFGVFRPITIKDIRKENESLKKEIKEELSLMIEAEISKRIEGITAKKHWDVNDL